METLTIEMPTSTLTVERPKCIGAFYMVYCEKTHRQHVASCIDATPEGRPKRLRLQTGERAGEVMMPGDYTIIERVYEWDD